MKYNSNLTCAAAFIEGECCAGNFGNVSFYGDEFYSYSTCISKKLQGYGQKVLLISRNNFSSTTAKHLSKLLGVYYKTPVSVGRLVFVPFEYNDRNVSAFTLADRFHKLLESFNGCDFSMKKERENFADLYRHAKIFSDKVLCLEYLNEPWIQNKVDKIRRIERYKVSRISNYTMVYIQLFFIQ